MNKRNSLIVLLIISILIILSGIVFSIFSFRINTKFRVLNTNIPGYIFGLIAVFLGIRYLRSLIKLKKKISNPDMKFSWENFNKPKKRMKKLKMSKKTRLI